ncbi:MAG: hypothetical protein WBP79_07170 [Candidatus Acidiferrales bacterium]
MPGRRKNKKAGKEKSAPKRRTKREAEAQPDGAAPDEIQKQASAGAIREILSNMFGDAAEDLVKSLEETNQLTLEERLRMKEIFSGRIAATVKRAAGKKK